MMPRVRQPRGLSRANYSTTGGEMTVVFDDEHTMHAIDWEDHEDRFLALLSQRDRRTNRRTALTKRELPVSIRTALDEYFSGSLKALHRLAVRLDGTAFENAVWEELIRIPLGETRTYAEIAKQIGKPQASRAVGAANGRNPIGVLVPCHRVIGANGSLTGYGGGLSRKQWLLDHEGALRSSTG